MDRQVSRLRQCCDLVVVWITSMGHFFWISFTDHFDLPGSESIFGKSQKLPTCVWACLSQDGFQWRGLWVADITPLLTSNELYSQEGLLDFENERYVVSSPLLGQDLASSLTPAVVEFLSTGNEPQLLTLGPIYPLLNMTIWKVRKFISPLWNTDSFTEDPWLLLSRPKQGYHHIHLTPSLHPSCIYRASIMNSVVALTAIRLRLSGLCDH